MLIATNERGHVVKRATEPAIGMMLAGLRRGDAHMVVERVEEGRPGSWYIQVLLRENNTYQLEYRDGVPEQHFQTLTVSQEKVLAALLGWAAAKPSWKDGFGWDNIGEQFGSRDHPASESAEATERTTAPEHSDRGSRTEGTGRPQGTVP
ncbi:hypothetical protein ACF1CG_13090 [Streptomyces sp. NPDC014773]|uniref:hypothetical protein n=1 Tax=Streptomyces sp. NPDC014773 TaxID=3364908 RepID=UPI0036FB80F2